MRARVYMDAGVTAIILLAVFFGLIGLAIIVMLTGVDPTHELSKQLVTWAGLAFTPLLVLLGAKHAENMQRRRDDAAADPKQPAPAAPPVSTQPPLPPPEQR